ncbi:hypothetical protein [Snodgrassella sp.]|uniref:hypothetical protein n=1 Tax=Snodgrassella sp. TaxID=2815304 RepID=UPI00258B50D3|nr:hypothetical protein [Snodgrassella sp.]MCO6526929.1 hypothetical protein [Snodgrassella sp.]
MLAKIKTLNRHVQLHWRSNKPDAMITTLLKHRIRVVIDHFGRSADSVPARDNSLQQLLHWGYSGMM